MKKKGTGMVSVDCAGAGDIVCIAGLASPSIGHTVANTQVRSLFATSSEACLFHKLWPHTCVCLKLEIDYLWSLVTVDGYPP